MLKTSIQLAPGEASIVTERDVPKESNFPLVIMLEDDGRDPSPSEFDTILLEIVFNDGDEVLVSSEPHERPVAGDLADRFGGAVDALSGEPLKPVRLQDAQFKGGIPQISLQDVTPLKLGRPTENPIGRYRNSTGKAGIRAQRGSLTLRPEDGPIVVALGKLQGGMKAAKEGTTSIAAVGSAFNGNKPVPLRSVVGRVSVV